MQKNEILAIITYLVIPLVGFIVFLKIRKTMILEKISKPPVGTLFLIFSAYGGLLLVAITGYFLQWSGMASLGAFYLIIIAPIMLLIAAYVQFKLRRLSNYHKWAFNLSVAYFIIAPIVITILVYTAK